MHESVIFCKLDIMYKYITYICTKKYMECRLLLLNPGRISPRQKFEYNIEGDQTFVVV